MNAHHTCSHLGSLLAASLILASGYAFAQTPTPTPAAPTAAASGPKTIGVPTKRRYSTALIVLNAKAGRLEGDKLILDGVLPTATLFTSRPVRTVGHMATPEMVEIWRTGSFAKDPPNATASVFSKDGSSVADVVVVLKAAKLEGEKLTFDVQVLEGSLGKADGAVRKTSKLSKGEVIELMGGQAEPIGIALDEGCVFWTSGGTEYQLIFRPLLPDEHIC